MRACGVAWRLAAGIILLPLLFASLILAGIIGGPSIVDELGRW